MGLEFIWVFVYEKLYALTVSFWRVACVPCEVESPLENISEFGVGYLCLDRDRGDNL